MAEPLHPLALREGWTLEWTGRAAVSTGRGPGGGWM